MLPIEQVIPELEEALAARNAAVLVAAPGAGKTTVVPLVLARQPWAKGRRIIVLEPRRIAARAAADHMAQTLGEKAGETVGYRVRMQSRVGPRTRVELVTEGVFTRMILDDPGLEGVAAVVFDEFHERSLDADLGLAFTRDSQSLLREDLRILVMSATLDGARVSRLLDDAPVIESAGRQYPVDTHYLGREPALRLEQQVARAVRRALCDETGSLLVFLPGQGEIRRTAELLAEQVGDPLVDIAPLYGALDARDQDRAIEPAPAGRRKVVLATSIAETSLTIEGVRVVIDSGLSREPRFDPASGLTRLETVRVTQASADQRRGRAGRTEPGVCYRLWDAAETKALRPFGRPEILDTDLSRLALDLARWGARGAEGLAFLDPPPGAAMTEARSLLVRLQALDEAGAITAHGRAMASLPLPPRLAHMVLRSAEAGEAGVGAALAALLVERGLGGTDTDLSHRLDRFRRESSQRARDARALAARWADLAKRAVVVRADAEVTPGLLLAEAYPERIAKARGKAGEFQLANGRGVFVEETDALASAAWLAVGELGGGATKDRILLAAALTEAELATAFADRMTTEEVVDVDGRGKVIGRRIIRLGRLVVRDMLLDNPDPEIIARRLIDLVREEGLAALPWSESAARLRQRVAFLRTLDPSAWPDLSDRALMASLSEWLAPLLVGKTALGQIRAAAMEEAMIAAIGWDRASELDRLAPASFQTPAGSRHLIDYGAEGGPRVEVRVQELFGLDHHPSIAGGRAALTLALTSPAHRPIQVTKDLPGFWRGSWKEVRAEMRGRYPKHPWPENPLEALPTTRAKPRS